MMNQLATTKVLHGWRYIGAPHVARMIRSVPHICNTQNYLECVVHYHDVLDVCQKFADAVGDHELRDPEIFLSKLDDSNIDEDRTI